MILLLFALCRVQQKLSSEQLSTTLATGDLLAMLSQDVFLMEARTFHVPSEQIPRMERKSRSSS